MSQVRDYGVPLLAPPELERIALPPLPEAYADRLPVAPTELSAAVFGIAPVRRGAGVDAAPPPEDIWTSVKAGKMGFGIADISREAPVLIAGPTASGKSALARQVAHAKETTHYYFQSLAGINPFECATRAALAKLPRLVTTKTGG